MIRPPCHRLAVLLVSTLVVPLAAQGQATWYAAYEDGLALQAKGKPGPALAAFQRAAELRPKPGARVLTYGMNFLDSYHPWLKIAQCALAVKDLDLAEEALKRSAQYNAEPATERQALQQKVAALRVPPAQAPASTPGQPTAPVQVPLQPQPPVTVPPSGAVATTSLGSAVLPPGVKAAPVQAPPPKALAAPAGPSQAPATTAFPAASPAASTAAPTQPQALAGGPTEAQGPPAPAPRRWAWWGLGLGGATLGLLGVAFLRRRGKAVPEALRQDLVGTVRLGDQDGTQRLTPSRLPSIQPSAAPQPDATQQGRVRLGAYRLEKVLGKGACGTTYLGIHESADREVAIKVPHPHMLEDAEFLARFHQEAALGTRLVHDKIVRILDPGPTEGTPWLAMELVRGITLDLHLKERGRLDLKEALSIALDVAEAIAYAHAQGVVHRDLKPANIMVGEKGAQVLDFGIARLTDGVGMTATQVFIGTPLYASPESIIHSRVGPGADRYALGIMLFEFLTGRPPFVGTTTFATLQMHQRDPLPDLAALVPDLDPRLVRLVVRLTDKKPENRPEDGEVLTILRQVLQGL